MADIEKFSDEKEAFLEQFESMRPDLFFPEAWSDEERDQAIEMVRPKRTRTTMFSSIPLRCEASNCVFADTCPLQQKNIAPKGYPCPIEMSMVSQFMQEYMHELGVNPQNLIEVAMIRDLVDQEVQYLRKTKLLAKEHFIQENFVGFDTEGNVVMKKELHLAVELEDRLHKRKKDLRNQLLATRQARAAAGGTHDNAQALSAVMDKIREIDLARENALKEKMGTLYDDEYIQDAEVVEQEDD